MGMGMKAFNIPMIDGVGSHVTYVSGVIFERIGDQVLATRYLETVCDGITTREIVGKDAMSVEALIGNAERAQIFLAELATNPPRTATAKH